MSRLVNLFRGRIYSVMNDDHSHLFQMLKELKRLASETGGNSDDAERRIKASAEKLQLLIDDTAIHFSREEVLMRSFRYTALNEHRNNHLQLLRSIQTYQTKFSREGKPLTATDFEYLDVWLTKHIQDDDRRLEEFFAEHPMVAEPDALTAKDKRAIGPHSVFFGVSKLLLWVKLRCFSDEFDKRKKNRDRALQNAASRMRHISQQKARIKSPKQQQEETNRSYSGWYYGNH